MRTWKKPVWARNFLGGEKALSLLQERISSCLGIRQAVAVPGKRIKVTKLPVGVQTGLSSSRGSTYYIHFHQKLFLQDLVLVFRDCYSRSRSFHTVMTLVSVDPMMLSKPLSAFTSALSTLPRHQAQKSPRSTGTR